jgi:hypothetical protein
LVIREVDPSCGCAQAKISRDRLGIGEAADLVLVADLVESYSKGQVSCLLTTDDPNHPVWEYSVDFETLPPVMITPSFVHLGRFTDAGISADGRLKDGPRATTVTIDVFRDAKSLDQPQPMIRGPEGFSHKLEATGPANALPNNIIHKKYLLHLSLDRLPDRLGGVQSRPFNIGDGGDHPASGTIAWRLDPDLLVTPEFLTFGTIDLEQRGISRRIIIRSLSKAPLRIVSAEGSSSDEEDQVEVKVQEGLGPNPMHTLEISFAPSKESRPGPRSGLIRITTDRDEGGPVTLPWTALLEPGDTADADGG